MRALHFVPVALLAVLAQSAAPQQPTGSATREDLDATVARWNSLVAPGKVVRTRAGTKAVFLQSEREIESLLNAAKIGDEADTLAEFIRDKRAFVESTAVDVRVLGSFQEICLALRTLGVACSDVPTTMRGLFEDLSNRRAIVGLPKDDRERRLAGLTAMFKNRDVSRFVANTYLFVRVLAGQHQGQKGYVKLSSIDLPTN
ncbi:MAG: hypothetical protein ABSD56_02075 [Bryobacteraceae bacterium]